MTIRWRTDFDKSCVVSNFERRGWEQHDAAEPEPWHIYWASVQTVYRIFQPDSPHKLEPYQLINHFPNHNELTRKDLMVKNIKRYQKATRKDGDEALDFLPATYMLPNDYPLFVEEFKRQPNATWIMKPAGRAQACQGGTQARMQGRGIFLINKLSQIKRWEKAAPAAKGAPPEVYVVSRYIDSPLLIGGKKFDLRLYVLVLSFKPLKVYVSDLGFARFCNVKYDCGYEDLDNRYMHLTNVAVQKHGDEYNAAHGNKWPLSKLRLWLEGTRGLAATERLFQQIDDIVRQSLRACQAALINDRHCFELYGYDIIVDSDLVPWLIEVNSSPSFAASTRQDRLMKAKVVHDTLSLVAPPEWQRGAAARPRSAGSAARGDATERGAEGRPPARCGSMRLLFDETQELATQRAARDAHLTRLRSQKRSTTLGIY